MSYHGTFGRRPARVRVPFMKKGKRVGAGDVVKKITNVVGIKTCEPCEERRRRMNSWLQFVG